MGIFSKKPKYAFSDILKGLYHTVGSAQEMLQAQQVQNLKKFWQETDGNPICQKVKSGDKEIDVPLMALVSHCHLEMEDMEIKFKTRISDVKAHSIVNRLDSKNSLTYAELQMVMDDIKVADNDVMDITIRFKLKDSPEGVAHLTDYYNKHI